MLDDVHCGEVRQAKAEASEKADGEVEDHDAGVSGELDVEGRQKEASCGEDNSKQ